MYTLSWNNCWVTVYTKQVLGFFGNVRNNLFHGSGSCRPPWICDCCCMAVFGDVSTRCCRQLLMWYVSAIWFNSSCYGRFKLPISMNSWPTSNITGIGKKCPPSMRHVLSSSRLCWNCEFFDCLMECMHRRWLTHTHAFWLPPLRTPDIFFKVYSLFASHKWKYKLSLCCQTCWLAAFSTNLQVLSLKRPLCCRRPLCVLNIAHIGMLDSFSTIIALAAHC